MAPRLTAYEKNICVPASIHICNIHNIATSELYEKNNNYLNLHFRCHYEGQKPYNVHRQQLQ